MTGINPDGVSLKPGDIVGYVGRGTILQGKKGRVLGKEEHLTSYHVRFQDYPDYDDTYDDDTYDDEGTYGGIDYHTVPRNDIQFLERPNPDTPESPAHYKRIKDLTGVEVWDILDEVAGDDPHMWNLGKYWFRCGHKEGQSSLVEKKKMLKYLERSIAKEEQTQ